MRRRIESITPFAFSSDFSAPQPETGQITLTADELAALLADTREATAALVRDETLSAQAEHLRKVSEDLKQALGAIVDLTTHLEKAAIDAFDRQTALQNIRKLATTLIDGQGELFAKSADHSPLGNHSD